MSSSRKGGTKYVNCVGASGWDTRNSEVCLISQEKGDMRYGGVSPFYLTA
jgi:hypothetical protein